MWPLTDVLGFHTLMVVRSDISKELRDAWSGDGPDPDGGRDRGCDGPDRGGIAVRRGHGAVPAAASRTSTGCPGFSSFSAAASGVASAMKTSLARLALL